MRSSSVLAAGCEMKNTELVSDPDTLCMLIECGVSVGEDPQLAMRSVARRRNRSCANEVNLYCLRQGMNKEQHWVPDTHFASSTMLLACRTPTSVITSWSRGGVADTGGGE